MKRLVCLSVALCLLFGMTACTAAPSVGDETPVTKAPVSMDEDAVTLIDNDGCTVSVADMYENADGIPTLPIIMHNKAPEHTYTFNVEQIAINGLQQDPYVVFSVEVPAGQTIRKPLVLADAFGEPIVKTDVGEWSDIALTFRVKDYDDYYHTTIAKETTHLYPRGKENAVSYVRQPAATDVVLFENEAVKVVAMDIHEEELGVGLQLYMENHSDKGLRAYLKDLTVNGIAVQELNTFELLPGFSMYDFVYMDTALKEHNIQTVEELGMTVRVADDKNTVKYTSEPIVYRP